jgi:hypothetical protein
MPAWPVLLALAVELVPAVSLVAGLLHSSAQQGWLPLLLQRLLLNVVACLVMAFLTVPIPVQVVQSALLAPILLEAL